MKREKKFKFVDYSDCEDAPEIKDSIMNFDASEFFGNTNTKYDVQFKEVDLREEDFEDLEKNIFIHYRDKNFEITESILPIGPKNLGIIVFHLTIKNQITICLPSLFNAFSAIGKFERMFPDDL